MKCALRAIEAVACRQLPRILTQISRDSGSSTYGCCDRNWWHYKIRDFPSIILQQTGYTLYLAGQLKLGKYFDGKKSELEQLAEASGLFWAERALGHGAFEEYYPYEQGYPPLAFSTLAVAKLALSGIVSAESIRPAMSIASKQLLSRFEAQAVNQQMAGIAAAAAIHNLYPELLGREELAKLLNRTLSLQHQEGWFPEYGGPDLGYLSVTMDCLWDIYDLTGDVRCRKALSAALSYIAWFTLIPPYSAGMLNSRNTDYIVPYSLARLSAEPSNDQVLASKVFNQLFSTADLETHFFASIDDRYWCHYIGHSLFRALLTLKSSCGAQDSLQGSQHNETRIPGFYLQGSEHVRLQGANAYPIGVVAGRKGGVTLLSWGEDVSLADYGWIAKRGGKEYVSHWWDSTRPQSVKPTSVLCQGWLVRHREHISSPAKHIILRFASFALGSRLIRILKRLLIFKKNMSVFQFTREVLIREEAVVIRDKIHGLRPGDTITRAPRQSKRHVASADCFHHEDLCLLSGVRCREKIFTRSDTWMCITQYDTNSLGRKPLF